MNARSLITVPPTQASVIRGALAEGNRLIALAEGKAARLPEPVRGDSRRRLAALRDEGHRIRVEARSGGLGFLPAAAIPWLVGAGVFGGGAWVGNWVGGAAAEHKRLDCIEQIMKADPTIDAATAAGLCNPQARVNVPPWAWAVGVGILALVALNVTRR